MTAREERNPLVFISHSHLDYDTAAFIKMELERYGISAFVAHQDIIPSRAWRNEIHKQLEACDLLIALLTRNFKASKWTDQECGIAIGLEKKILPVRIDYEPYGFLADYQVLKWDEERKWPKRRELLRIVIDELGAPTKCLVRGLVTAPSFDDAGFAVGELVQRTDLTNDEINQIAAAYLDNNQIRDSSSAREGMKWFFHVYGDRINPRLRRRVIGIPAGRPRGMVVGARRDDR